MSTTATGLKEMVSSATTPIDYLREIRLQERQHQAFRTSANEVLFGGAKYGGKSFLLRGIAINLASACPGIQIYLFRRTYQELIANHMEGEQGFRGMLAPLVNEGRVQIVGDKKIRFTNGSNIFLRYLAKEDDVTRYQGIDIHVALFDELTQLTETMYLYIAMTCVRLGTWQAPFQYRDYLPRIVAGTNPGGIGHHWVKRRWIDFQEPYEIVTIEGRRRQFIPARAEDNPAGLRNDPTYLDRLEASGNPALVKAYRDGDWNIVAGSMFGDEFRRTFKGRPWHVVAPVAIPASWPIWRGGDDAFASPASIHWLTQDPDIGTIYVIREIYQNGLLPERLAKMILRYDANIRLDYGNGDYDLNDQELDGVLDSASFSDVGTGAQTRGAQMNALGCNWQPVEKGKGSRVARVQLMHKLLKPNPRDPKGFPGIRFFSNCTKAIETIPTIPIDKKNPEDIDTDAEDHAFDSITYGCSRRRRFFGTARVRGL